MEMMQTHQEEEVRYSHCGKGSFSLRLLAHFLRYEGQEYDVWLCYPFLHYQELLVRKWHTRRHRYSIRLHYSMIRQRQLLLTKEVEEEEKMMQMHSWLLLHLKHHYEYLQFKLSAILDAHSVLHQ